ncbi:MAG: hypothetical protein ACFFCW_28335 [Candidatus Hodarchaeota archaeon]
MSRKRYIPEQVIGMLWKGEVEFSQGQKMANYGMLILRTHPLLEQVMKPCGFESAKQFRRLHLIYRLTIQRMLD